MISKLPKKNYEVLSKLEKKSAEMFKKEIGYDLVLLIIIFATNVLENQDEDV